MSPTKEFEQSSAGTGSKEFEEKQEFIVHGVKVNIRPSEKEFVQELFDALAAIPTGRQAIEDMKKYNATLLLEPGSEKEGGFYDQHNNNVVLNPALGLECSKFCLVHEARHLLQYNQGRREAEALDLDYASRLMINRATEADAQAQAMQACKEWEAIGQNGPLKSFEKHFKPIVDAYNKNNSISDAYKGWYADEHITASYEQGYDVEYYINTDLYTFNPENRRYLPKEPPADCPPPVSLKPSDIAKFCGGDRIEDFEEFMNSKEARQVHLLTKVTAELHDELMFAAFGVRDPSLADIPVRDLKDNPSAQIFAARYIKETRKDFSLDNASTDSPKKTTYSAIISAVKDSVDAVEKINAAAIKGEHNTDAEKALSATKKRLYSEIKEWLTPKKSSSLNKTATTLKGLFSSKEY